MQRPDRRAVGQPLLRPAPAACPTQRWAEKVGNPHLLSLKDNHGFSLLEEAAEMCFLFES